MVRRAITASGKPSGRDGIDREPPLATQLVDSEPNSQHYAFKIGLVIKHPHQDLRHISNLIEINSDSVRVAGAQRQTPTGRLVSDVYAENIWSSYNLVEDEKDFVSIVDRFLEHLLRFKESFIQIAATGGSCKIIVQLPGYLNTGLELRSASASKLAELQIDLGLEVFPQFRVAGHADLG